MSTFSIPQMTQMISSGSQLGPQTQLAPSSTPHLLQLQQNDASLIAQQLQQQQQQQQQGQGKFNSKTNSRKPYTEEEVFALIDFYSKYTSNGLNAKQRFHKLGPNRTVTQAIADEMSLKFPNSLKIFDKENIRKKLDEIKLEYMVFRYLQYKSSGFGWLASEGRFNMDSLNIDYYKNEYVEMGGQLNGKTDTFKKLMKHGNFYIYHYHELIGRNLQFDLDFDKSGGSPVDHSSMGNNVNIEPELMQHLPSLVPQQQQQQLPQQQSPLQQALPQQSLPQNSLPQQPHTQQQSIPPQPQQQRRDSQLSTPSSSSESGPPVSNAVNKSMNSSTSRQMKRLHSELSLDEVLLDVILKMVHEEPESFKFSELCELSERYRVVRTLLISRQYDFEYKKKCLREF